MRIFFLALALLLVISVGIVFFTGFLERETDRLLSLVDTLSRTVEAENWDEAGKAMEKVKQEWEKLSPRLALFTDHSLLDEIMSTSASAGGYVRYREAPETMAEIEVLRSLIRHIPIREKLSLYNIL